MQQHLRYPSLSPGQERLTCYWFIGIIIDLKNTNEKAGGSLDLTTPIKNFTEMVMRSAIQINVWKTGMKIEAYHRKRKALASYLPMEEHYKLRGRREVSVTGSPNPSSLPGLGREANGNGDGGGSPAKKRSLSEAPEEDLPPLKKTNTGDGEAVMMVDSSGSQGDSVSQEAERMVESSQGGDSAASQDQGRIDESQGEAADMGLDAKQGQTGIQVGS